MKVISSATLGVSGCKAPRKYNDSPNCSREAILFKLILRELGDVATGATTEISTLLSCIDKSKSFCIPLPIAFVPEVFSNFEIAFSAMESGKVCE